MKTKKIYLEHLPYAISTGGPVWIVATLVNSVEFDPHQHLNKKQVEELCAANTWEVHIKERK